MIENQKKQGDQSGDAAKKLRLHKETLRDLSPKQRGQVKGGAARTAGPCNTGTCCHDTNSVEGMS